MSIGSLKCHSSPPHNPWRARRRETRPPQIRGWRRVTFQTRPYAVFLAMQIFTHRCTGRGGGGVRGAAAPPNFGQLRFFGQQEKIFKTFKDVFMFFFINILKRWIFSILTCSRRNNPVTFTRDSGCQARDEFLFIREDYHMLSFFIVGHCTVMGYLQSWIY